MEKLAIIKQVLAIWGWFLEELFASWTGWLLGLVIVDSRLSSYRLWGRALFLYSLVIFHFFILFVSSEDQHNV